MPGLLERREDLRVGLERPNLGRRRLMGELQDESRRERAKRKVLKTGRGGHHVALEVVLLPAKRVELQPGLQAVGKQAGLVVLSAAAKQLDGVCHRHRFAYDWIVGRHDGPHPALDHVQVGLGEWRMAAHFAVVAADRRGRVLDIDLGLGKDLRRGHHHDE